MKYFDRAITPNEAFFVRYHIFPSPASVDPSTRRLIMLIEVIRQG
jgi:hypothetical protein